MIRIFADGPFPSRIRVTTADGAEVTGITELTLLPVTVDSMLVAKVSLIVGGIDVMAHPLLALESVRNAAKEHGYRLVKADDPVDVVDL